MFWAKLFDFWVSLFSQSCVSVIPSLSSLLPVNHFVLPGSSRHRRPADSQNTVHVGPEWLDPPPTSLSYSCPGCAPAAADIKVFYIFRADLTYATGSGFIVVVSELVCCTDLWRICPVYYHCFLMIGVHKLLVITWENESLKSLFYLFLFIQGQQHLSRSARCDYCRAE